MTRTESSNRMTVVRLNPDDLVVYWESFLGEGGAGRVCKGRLTEVANGSQRSRDVAVKIIDGSCVGKTEKDVVEHEVRLLTALSKHHSVCSVVGHCVKDGRECVVLKLYAGNLADYIRAKPDGHLRLQEAVQLGEQLAAALVYLHTEANVAHFDIKPANILMDDDCRCVLADFSIAHQFQAGETHFKPPHDGYGSVNSMAPEQARDNGRGITFAADIWGLGCTLLEMVTGRQPFHQHTDIMSILHALVQRKAPTVPSTLEARFAHIIRQCFAPQADARPEARIVHRQLRQLSAILRIEAGGRVDVPQAVLDSLELTTRCSLADSASATSPATSAQPDLLSVPMTQEVDLLSMDMPMPDSRSATAAPGAATPSSSTAAYATDQMHNARASSSDQAPWAGDASNSASRQSSDQLQYLHRVGQAQSDSCARPEASALYEPAMVTACVSGGLGIKCLFRSFTRSLENPTDRKQMTGVALLPRGAEAPVTEAVSVSAGGNLTWWDLQRGCVTSNTAVSRTAEHGIGRAVAANESIAIVGTDKSTVSVWQCPNGSSSQLDALAAQSQGDIAAPRCVASVLLSDPSSAKEQVVYDMSLQSPWMEHAGGEWVAAATSAGRFSIWDTETWQEVYSAAASSSSIFSCCTMPGSNMLALACHGQQLVQVWDCRQRGQVAQVMTCDVDPASSSDCIYCVSTVPSRGGHIPSQLLMGSKLGRLYVWDLRSPNALWVVAQISDRVLGCACSPCGRRVVAAGNHGQVAMLDWTRPIHGRVTTPGGEYTATVCECHNPIFMFPHLEQGFLRAACGNIATGNLIPSSSSSSTNPFTP